MNVWKDFGRIFGCAALIVAPVFARADGFESVIVTDETELVSDGTVGDVVLPEPAEAILVEPLDMPAPVDQDDDSSYVVDDSPSGFYGTCTAAECCDSTNAMGTINRILRDVTPRFVAQVDALMLWQGAIPSRVLFTDAGTGAAALNANQAQPPMSAGPRYALFLNLDPMYAIEGNYFNVRSFSGQSITPPGSYNKNNLAGFGQFGPVDAAGVFTSGNIQSAELNWRRRTCGPITWLGGFRWVEWNDQMQIGEVVAGTPIGGFATQAGNDLYGGQIGMDVCLWGNKKGLVKVNGVGKSGIFYNTAYQRTGADFGLAQGPIVAGAVADQTAFFGEVGANASVRLASWLSWRAGYTLFWLSGVATSANQLSTTNLAANVPTATINTNGSVLLHGVTTGLEARW